MRDSYDYSYVVAMTTLIMDRDIFTSSFQNSPSSKRKLTKVPDFLH